MFEARRIPNLALLLQDIAAQLCCGLLPPVGMFFSDFFINISTKAPSQSLTWDQLITCFGPQMRLPLGFKAMVYFDLVLHPMNSRI